MKEINWGIIGCGDVTEKKSGPAFNKIEGSKLSMVMRRNEEKLKDYANRHSIERCSTDYNALLEDDSIDAIYIATPPYMHCFYTSEAARHKKIVYVEKPMATSVYQCNEMINACKQNDVALFVAYYRRGQEKFNRVKQLLTSGAIGDVHSFNYVYTGKPYIVDPNRDWLMDKQVAGDGLLYDIGSHMVDIMLYLFGDVSHVSGTSKNTNKNYNVNDTTSGYMTFKNGMQGSLQLSFNSNERLDELLILGSSGSIRFSIMSNEPVELKNGDAVKKIAFEEMEHVQMPFIQQVVDTIQGNGNLDDSGTYGLRTQEVLEALSQGKSLNY